MAMTVPFASLAAAVMVARRRWWCDKMAII